MDIDSIKKDHDHDENHDTKEDYNVCFVGRETTMEKSLFLVRNVRPTGGRVHQHRCRQRK